MERRLHRRPRRQFHLHRLPDRELLDGADRALPLHAGAAGETAYSGPPRLVGIEADGLTLNGIVMEPRTLLTQLVRLTESGEDVVVLRPDDAASLQRLVEVMELMRAAGFTNLAIVEAAP